MGGYDIHQDETHRWMDSTPVESTGFTNWNGVNPHHGVDDYMQIWASNGLWADGDLEYHKYICESGLI